MSDTLFPGYESWSAEPAAPAKRPVARLLYADRRQVLLRPSDLESLLAEDHRARVVWAFVAKLDLTAFHARSSRARARAGARRSTRRCC